ncbi:DUF2705 family protein [Falsibacillus albus]|uniref:Uncharacterized protein n=1 Tax=Falsibacillus albus TaxID=2478915 RepID=A0A3L7JVY3_9BACI|nr:DUF2705 family protein [Falsibacillus albus]RLQ94883.1 hypothetical protein D9X91_12945 [Falsibacillus albus]
MFKSHIIRISKNRISMLAFLLILFIPFIEIIQLLTYQQNSAEVYHPAFAFFLSGSSIGHAPQILLFWFLPIFLLLLGADDAIQDRQTGYRNILISKVGRKRYFSEKLTTSFILSAGAMGASLLLNFLLTAIIFAGGTFSKGLLDINDSGNTLFELSIGHPYAAIACFAVLVCIIAGLIGMVGASASLFFGDKKYAYTAAFFIWFLLVLKKNSIMFLFQPFAEYGFHVLIPILMLAVFVFVTIPLLVYVYGVKFNED